MHVSLMNMPISLILATALTHIHAKGLRVLPLLPPPPPPPHTPFCYCLLFRWLPSNQSTTLKACVSGMASVRTQPLDGRTVITTLQPALLTRTAMCTSWWRSCARGMPKGRTPRSAVTRTCYKHSRTLSHQRKSSSNAVRLASQTS